MPRRGASLRHLFCWLSSSAALVACGASGAAERTQLTASAPGSPPVTMPAAPAAGARSSAPPITSSRPDGGVLIPVADPCADGGCEPPEPRVPDDDGFSVADGDCDDFALLVNPGAYDIPNNGVDEDCQGGDATTDACDDMLELSDDDPLAAAAAIELCPTGVQDSKRWGVVSARWTTPDGLGEPGSPLMHGLLPGLGPAFVPRAGKRMLALSSGVARAPGQPDFTRDCGDDFPVESTGFPKNFDGTSSSCSVDEAATMVVDAIALELQVRAPTNASALSFDSAFFTDEYPVFICTPFNDFFQVIVQPLRMGGTADGNVVFDRDNNAVSVNNSLLGVCNPGTHGEKTFECPLGFEPLEGTGFEECEGGLLATGGTLGGLARGEDKYGASTGWLTTEFAVEPGELLTLRFTIWDSSDSELDSLALIDHVRFRFRDEPPPPDKPMTMPVGPD